MKPENKKSDWVIPLNLTKINDVLVSIVASFLFVFFLMGGFLIGLWGIIIFINLARLFEMPVCGLTSFSFLTLFMISWLWFADWARKKFDYQLKKFRIVK